MEKTSNSKVPQQRDPIYVVCGLESQNGAYICVAKDGSSACDQGIHDWEDIQNWNCCAGVGTLVVGDVTMPCPNPYCFAPRFARLV